ncbi:hypothetical protein PFISCL1PPCAC_22185, partial [Pristionchus fissidentatus]
QQGNQANSSTIDTICIVAKHIINASLIVCIAFAPLLAVVDERAFFMVNIYITINLIITAVILYCHFKGNLPSQRVITLTHIPFLVISMAVGVIAFTQFSATLS